MSTRFPCLLNPPVRKYSQYVPNTWRPLNAGKSGSLSQMLDAGKSGSPSRALNAEKSGSLSQMLNAGNSSSLSRTLDAGNSDSLSRTLNARRSGSPGWWPVGVGKSVSLSRALNAEKSGPLSQTLNARKSGSLSRTLGARNSGSPRRTLDARNSDSRKWRPLSAEKSGSISLLNAEKNDSLSQTLNAKKSDSLSRRLDAGKSVSPGRRNLSEEFKTKSRKTASAPQKKTLKKEWEEDPTTLPAPPQGDVYPDLKCEERVIGDRFPISYRIYHPHTISPLDAKIFYIPPPTSTFFPLEQVIKRLSYITSATIITPLPPDTIKPFPQPLHNLLRIYDDCNKTTTPTAVLTSGIAASLAAAIALTEQSVHALGVWGGILDLTANAEKAAAWDRKHENWVLFKWPLSHPAAAATEKRSELEITKKEFWDLRKQYFPNPETWADPFASPQLLCRGAPVEFSRLTLKEIWGKEMAEEFKKDRRLRDQGWLDTDDEGNYVYPRRQARIFQNFPPEGTKRPLPWIYLVVPEHESKDGVTVEQGTAFVGAVHTALAQWLIRNRDKKEQGSSENAMVISKEQISTDRFKEDKSWENAVEDMGRWLVWVFRQVPKKLK